MAWWAGLCFASAAHLNPLDSLCALSCTTFQGCVEVLVVSKFSKVVFSLLCVSEPSVNHITTKMFPSHSFFFFSPLRAICETLVSLMDCCITILLLIFITSPKVYPPNLLLLDVTFTTHWTWLEQTPNYAIFSLRVSSLKWIYDDKTVLTNHL